MESPSRLWIARAILALFLVAWLGPGLLPGRHLTVAGYLGTTAVWRSALPADLPLPVIPDQSAFLVDYPNLLLTHQELMDGRAPVRLPNGAGMPFLANPQAAPASVWHLPGVLSGSLAFHSWAWALRALAGAALGFLLARRLGLGPEGAAWTGAVLAAGGILASQFLLTSPSALVLLPLLILLAERAHGAGREPGGWREALLLGLVAGLVPLQGHPEPAFVAALGGGIWWMARELPRTRGRGKALGSLAGRALLAATACLLTAAPALLPFLVFLPRSAGYKTDLAPGPAAWGAGLFLLVFLGVGAVLLSDPRRRRVLHRLKERAGQRLSLAPSLIVTLALAFILAWLVDPYRWVNAAAFPRGQALTLADRLTDPAFLTHLYPGLVLLPLAPWGWRRLRNLRPVLGTLLVVGLGLAWTLPPFDLLRLLPGLWTLSPFYAAPLLLLPLALLAGAGLEELSARPGRLAVLATVGAGTAVVWHVYRAELVEPLDRVMREPRALAAAALLVLAVFVLWLVPRHAVGVALSLALLDLFLHAYPYARPMPPFRFDETPPVRSLRRALEDGGRFVAVTDPRRPVPRLAPPNTLAVHGLQDVRLCSPLRPRSLLQYWEQVDSGIENPTLLLTGAVDSVVWDLLDVRVVLTPTGWPVPKRYQLLYGDPGVEIWKRPPLGESGEVEMGVARMGHGFQAWELPGRRNAETWSLVYGAWDRWAGMAGPVLLLLGLAGVGGSLAWRGGSRGAGPPQEGERCSQTRGRPVAGSGSTRRSAS